MSTVYTMGYEGTDIDRFVATLKTVGVRVLADVRAVALSRKKGFSKTALKARLEGEGISYLHFAELGDPKSGREAARAGKMGEFRSIYTKHLRASKAQAAVKVLAETVNKSPTCLLCFERDPTVCHRSLITQSLKTFGVTAFDLYGDLPNRYVNHTTKLPRSHPGQGLATAEQAVR